MSAAGRNFVPPGSVLAVNCVSLIQVVSYCVQLERDCLRGGRYGFAREDSIKAPLSDWGFLSALYHALVKVSPPRSQASLG
jgi:hypothetical protein